jgi:hypothetical protein
MEKQLDPDNLFDDSGADSNSYSAIDEEEDIPHGEVDYVHDVSISMVAQVGSVQKTMREILSLKSGST